MKINIAIAALFSAAAFLTPAQATSIAFTATTTFPSAGNYPSPEPLALSSTQTGPLGNIEASAYTGVFTSSSATTLTASSTWGPAEVAVGSDGYLGVDGPSDAPNIAQGEGVVLDFATVNANMSNQKDTVSNVSIGIDDIAGASGVDWVVYGYTNGTASGTGTEVASGLTTSTGLKTASINFTPTSSLYTSYLIAVQDCQISITSIDVTGTTPGTTTTTTPEPGTFVMAGIALIGLGVTMKRRNRKA